MDCLITNGRNYIRLNENGSPVTCAKDAAQRFSESKAKNILESLPKSMQKFNFKVKLIPEITPKFDDSIIQIKKKPDLDAESKKILSELDDFYYDYREEKSSDKDNPFTYYGRTYIEDNISDVGEEFKAMVIFLSQMNKYIQNMRYMIREYDLQILDIRHFIRNHKTKLGTVHMAKLAYLQQELERKRAECKRNMNYCLVFNNHLDRLTNEKYINIIEEISESEYRYRRLDEETINKAIGRCEKK